MNQFVYSIKEWKPKGRYYKEIDQVSANNIKDARQEARRRYLTQFILVERIYKNSPKPVSAERTVTRHLHSMRSKSVPISRSG